jgi:hypothetical protein
MWQLDSEEQLLLLRCGKCLSVDPLTPGAVVDELAESWLLGSS